MRRVRVFRVNGDSLSCWFSPEGALSSAILRVEGQEYDVAGQLPGLTVETAGAYLTDLGYVREHNLRGIRIGKTVNECLEETGIFVEAVWCVEESVLLSIVLVEDRTRACCRRCFVAIQDDKTSRIHFEAVRQNAHIVEFLAQVR